MSFPSGRAYLLASVAVLLAIASIAGCGKTVIDDVKTEDAIEQNLEDSVGKKVKTVECPTGVEVEVGESFDCAVTLSGGSRETATLEILNEDADVELTDLQPNK